MKKLAFYAVSAIAVLLLSSCGKNTYKSFVGTWGVEKIEYYNIDFNGNPIPESLETFIYDPNDYDNSIRLSYKSNKTGEMRDSAWDSIYSEVDSAYIQCPDTVFLSTFTYSYDRKEAVLYMNMSNSHTFKLNIKDLGKNSYIYENEYLENRVEKGYLTRLSKKPSKSSSRQKVAHPHHPGSFLGDR